LYTYTVITTDSNKQLKFLHDRMPVIFNPGSEKIKQWVDPARHEWSRELQSLLKPFDGELEVYPVSKDVGKVGNNSPSFIIPVNSKENKSNIANFFSNAQKKDGKDTKQTRGKTDEAKVKDELHVDHVKKSLQTSSPPLQEKRKDPPTESASPPLKKLASEKAKISSTKNEYKSPKKAKAPGSQKITSFFGNAS
jgi:hypothetical protein